LHRVRTNDYEHLEETLRSLPAGVSRMFCIDGVNSMTGNVPDLPTYARICREYDTLLYVDDAHGFGVIGESPTPEMRTVGAATALSDISGRHTTMSCWWRFLKVLLVTARLLALPTAVKNHLKVAASPTCTRAFAHCVPRDRARGLPRQRRRG